jgi:hypothetical protein
MPGLAGGAVMAKGSPRGSSQRHLRDLARRQAAAEKREERQQRRLAKRAKTLAQARAAAAGSTG